MSKKASKTDSTCFIWTDDEVHLLLRVTLEYKVNKTHENVDWESCQTKYREILASFQEQYPNGVDGRDFPHSRNEITKVILTTKLKAIRGKYRQAVDSGRRSGHGRVVLLYFELCEQIWGGSPATTTITSGVETTDLQDTTFNTDSTSTMSPNDASLTELSDVSDITEENEDQRLPASVVKERRDLLQAKLTGFRSEKLKRKLSVETQLLNAAQEELHVKKRMLEMMENSEKQTTEHLNKITTNIDKLTSSIAEGFSFLKQIMIPQSSYTIPPYYSQPQGTNYPYGQITSHHPPPPATSATLPVHGFGQFSYTQALLQEDKEYTE